MHDKLNYLFLFQGLIKEGSLTLKLTNIISLNISRDYIIVDIENPSTLKNIIKAVSIKSKENNVKSFFEKINDLKTLLSEISKASEILVKEKKTFILRYKKEDVLIVGYEARGGVLLKNIKIVNKLLLIKMLNEFRS